MNTKFILLIFFVSSMFYGCLGVIKSVDREELSGDYIYNDEGGTPFIFRDFPDRKFIPTMVVDYSYNDSFIIALQKEYKIDKEKINEYSDDELYDLYYEKGKDFYWIISHEKDSIYGPLLKQDYIKMKKVIGIPQSLRLESE